MEGTPVPSINYIQRDKSLVFFTSNQDVSADDISCQLNVYWKTELIKIFIFVSLRAWHEGN